MCMIARLPKLKWHKAKMYQDHNKINSGLFVCLFVCFFFLMVILTTYFSYIKHFTAKHAK